jgi:hypothetical protein
MVSSLKSNKDKLERRRLRLFQQLAKHFMWCVIIKNASWPVVQGIADRVELLL